MGENFKTLGLEQDGAEPTDTLQRALLRYEEEEEEEEEDVGDRICTLRNLRCLAI
jgi:hypothetical protein